MSKVDSLGRSTEMEGEEFRPSRDHPVLRFVLDADWNLLHGVANLVDLGLGALSSPWSAFAAAPLDRGLKLASPL